jgi:hypothetical protein
MSFQLLGIYFNPVPVVITQGWKIIPLLMENIFQPWDWVENLHPLIKEYISTQVLGL